MASQYRRYARSAWISRFALISSGASLPRRAPPPLWETSRAATGTGIGSSQETRFIAASASF